METAGIRFVSIHGGADEHIETTRYMFNCFSHVPYVVGPANAASLRVVVRPSCQYRLGETSFVQCTVKPRTLCLFALQSDQWCDFTSVPHRKMLQVHQRDSSPMRNVVRRCDQLRTPEHVTRIGSPVAFVYPWITPGPWAKQHANCDLQGPTVNADC